MLYKVKALLTILVNYHGRFRFRATKYPEFEAQSLSETFYYLRQAIHYMNPEQESLSFSYRQYRENKFIIGMSFEKMHGKRRSVFYWGNDTRKWEAY